LLEGPEQHDRRPPWLCCICNDKNLNDAYEPVEGALPVAPAQDSGRAMGPPWIDSAQLWWRGLLRKGKELHLGSLRGSL
jgi:hypothetical protein